MGQSEQRDAITQNGNFFLVKRKTTRSSIFVNMYIMIIVKKMQYYITQCDYTLLLLKR